ncbi:MAG TPA: STAS domain-containing protein [Miltoncostaeaceae bacterium]|nr:STAS domain-containing protein [Miltoncostaeaceae bacterium]
MVAPPDTSEFRVAVEVLPTVVLVLVAGEVDLATAPAVAEAAHRGAAEANGDSPLVLDLSAVDYMDSSGLRMLNELRTGFGDRLALHRPSHAVVRVLEVTGMAAHFSRVEAY